LLTVESSKCFAQSNRAIFLDEFLAAPNSANVCLLLPHGSIGVASDYAPRDLILDFLRKLLTVALGVIGVKRQYINFLRWLLRVFS